MSWWILWGLLAIGVWGLGSSTRKLRRAYRDLARLRRSQLDVQVSLFRTHSRFVQAAGRLVDGKGASLEDAELLAELYDQLASFPLPEEYEPGYAGVKATAAANRDRLRAQLAASRNGGKGPLHVVH